MLMPSEFRLFFIILCYVGTNVLRKETGHSNSGLLWGSTIKPSILLLFITKRSGTFTMKLFSF
ncbi:uncharacterized protein DS421_8g238960 [Arachis hypogaea]|nr:uncharacterized protein DS421_8g238960 [Arachis hypogaea]